jgi:hypothetical protein
MPQVSEVSVSGWLNHRRYTANKEQLDRDAPSWDLERVEVKTKRPNSGQNEGPFTVTLHWPDEDPATLDGLKAGERTELGRGQYIELLPGESRWQRHNWWLLALILLALLIWLSVFGYLYFTA